MKNKRRCGIRLVVVSTVATLTYSILLEINKINGVNTWAGFAGGLLGGIPLLSGIYLMGKDKQENEEGAQFNYLIKMSIFGAVSLFVSAVLFLARKLTA